MSIAAIYDAIDRENFSDAIKLCQKPGTCDHPLTLALLSYCFAKTRKSEEALAIVRRVTDGIPTDESVISTLAHTVKALRADENIIIECYENAIKANPRCGDALLIELFFCYVREYDPKKMQLIAQKLYKNTGSRNFIFWAVVSIIHQIPKLPPSMIVVAEKMLNKALFETSSQSYDVKYQPGSEELLIYVNLMLSQGKVVEALESFDSISARPKGPTFIDNSDFEVNGHRLCLHKLSAMMLRAQILKQGMTSYPDDPRFSFEVYSSQLRLILSHYSDQWEAHSQLNTAVCNAILKNQSVYSEHLSYLESLQRQNCHLRGPWLAELDFIASNIKLGLKSDSIMDFDRSFPGSEYVLNYLVNDDKLCIENNPDYVQSLKRYLKQLCHYIEKFQSKQCLFSDIRQYFILLHPHPQVFEALIEWINQKLVGLQSEIYEFKSKIDSAVDDVANDIKSISIANNSKNKSANKSKGKSKAVKNPDPQETLDKLCGDIRLSSKGKLRCKAIESICGYCKFSQIAFFCKELILVSKRSNLDTPTVNLPKLFCEDEPMMIQLFSAARGVSSGGIGGDREVQPSDELLLLLSNYRREKELAAVDPFIKVKNLMRRVRILLAGMEASPHTYTFKLEAIETFRALALAEPAVVAFNGMQARFVQCDTMSYIIVPCLLEGGFFTEAIRQNRSVLSFHTSAVNDTADMISRSFKSASYDKCVELRHFIDRCKRSTQLALSKSEIPLLELLYRLDLTDTMSYLKDYFDCKLSESFKPLFKGSDASSWPLDCWEDYQRHLVENMDYDLLVRYDSASAVAEVEVATASPNYIPENVSRRKQFLDRIFLNLQIVRLIRCALLPADNVESENLDRQHLEQFKAFIRDKTDRSVEPIWFWDQSIPVFDGPHSFIALECLIAIFEVAFAHKALFDVCATDSGSLEMFENSSSRFCELLTSLHAALSDPALKYIHGSDGAIAPLSHRWMKSASCVVLYLANAAALLVTRLLQSSKGLKSRLTINRVAVALIEFFDLFQKMLQFESDDRLQSPEAYLSFISHVAELDSCNDIETGETLTQVSNLAEQFYSSQKMSCLRLREAIKGKAVSVTEAI